MVANNSFLLLFVAPVLLVTLYGVAICSLYLTNRYFKSQFLGIFFGGALIIFFGVSLFLIEVQSDIDCSIEEPLDPGLFLKFYLANLLKK